MNATAAEARARKMIASRTTAQLLSDWDLTDKAEMTPELPIVRGWLMDEMQNRDPEAYDAWMDDESLDASPRKYFTI